MKRAYLIMAVALVLGSCEKEDDPPVNNDPINTCTGSDRNTDLISGPWYFHYNQPLDFFGCCITWSHEYRPDSLLVRHFDTEDGTGRFDTIKWYWTNSDGYSVTQLRPDAGGTISEYTFSYRCVSKDTLFYTKEITSNESIVTHTNPY